MPDRSRSWLLLPLLALLLACEGGAGGADAGRDAGGERDAGAPVPPPLLDPAWHGVIEGFYGEPYTPEARLSMIDFLGELGLRRYVYGPKDDPYHRERWREPYPPATLAHFAEASERAREGGLRFVYAISPGGDYDPEAGDEETLLRKLDSVLDQGVSDLCVFFDDVAASSPGAQPQVQVELISRLRAHLLSRAPEGSLCFVGPYYFGTSEQLRADDPPPFITTYRFTPSEYYAAYRALPQDVPIFWTGRHVIPSSVTAEELSSFRRWVARPLLLWDNIPVNDLVLSGELFLSPWEGRGPELTGAADGILLNLGTQAEASKIALATMARALLHGEEPAAAHPGAVAAAAGASGEAELSLLVSHFMGHPFIGEGDEAPTLNADMRAFLASPSPSTAAALRASLEDLSTLGEDIDALGNRALREELRAPADQIAALAGAALAALDAWEARERGEAVDLEALDMRIEAARAGPFLPAANTALTPGFASFLSDRPPTEADVYSVFFEGVRPLLE